MNKKETQFQFLLSLIKIMIQSLWHSSDIERRGLEKMIRDYEE